MKEPQPLRLRLDPWQAEYGTGLPLAEDTERSESSESVDPSVETPVANWQPIRPSETASTLEAFFVDGVRRVEAHVLGRRDTAEGPRIIHGVFGAYGAGWSRVSPGQALLGEAYVDRLLVLGSGEDADPAAVAPGVTYRPLSAAESDPDAPIRCLQEEMRRAEKRVARELALAGNSLVIADGPLTFADGAGAAVGYVKRLFQLYVSLSLLPVLEALLPGTRSPLFALAGTVRFSRYSWFLRLAAPIPGGAATSGVVRLEVADTVGLDAARRLADATTLFLPRLAPAPGRDPRAPQNLRPIAALETHLRHHLGDPRQARRRIQTHLAREAQP